MKKTISFVLTACVSLSFVPGSVRAAQNLTAKYDLSKSSLAVSSSYGEANADLLTTVSVFPWGNSMNDSVPPAIFKTVFTDDEGDIDVLLKIPSSFESNKYTVRVANETGSYDEDFLYAKSSDIRAAMILLNGASTASEAKSIITSNYAKLALDPVKAAPCVAELAKAYIDICGDTEYTDETEFYSDFMQCLAAAEITCCNDAQLVLNNYKIYIGAEVDKIKTYPQSVRSLLLQYASESDYSDGFLSEQLPKLRVLAFFKSAQTSGAAKLSILGTDASGNEYIDNFDILNPDLTYYSLVGNVNLVYDKVFAQRGSITSFDALKKAFESASQSVYDEENKKNPPKGGASGSVPTASFTTGTQITPDTGASLFSDISGHWAQSQIELLAKSGVISGYPDLTFKPANYVTRAEFAKMITSFAGISAQDAGMNFADVDESDWFYQYILKAYSGGLVNGISETEFMPNRQISRQDVCVIIARYLEDQLSGLQASSFSDSALVAQYAKEAVDKLSAAGILTGYEDGSFRPQNPITRAETAVILTRVAECLR